MSEQEEVLYDVKDRIATVTLNRPDRMNWIDDSMPGNIAKAMVKAANDPGVRCIILTGAGRAFCAGADIGRLQKRSGGVRPPPPADAPRGGLRFAIADNGSRIATGGEDKTIHLWGRSGQQTPIVIRGHAGNITALAFNPGATVLASAATDLSIRLWDAATGEPLETMMGHAGTIGDLRFSSDGSRLVSIAQDGTIRIWTRNPRESTCILRGHSSYIYSVAFTPDGKRIVSGAWDQTIRLWDAASGRALAATEPAGAGFVTALAVSPDGRRIASGHVNRKWTIVRFCIWDVDTLRLEDDIPFDGGEVHTLAFEPDDLRLWTCDQKFGAGWLDLNRTPPVAHRVVERQPAFSMALSPDGSRVAIGTDRGAVCIADAATGRTLREWTDHKGEVRALAWSPSGPILASAATDGNIRLRNPDTGELLARLNGHWDTVHCLAFSPDGKVLASGSGDTTIRIWDTGSGDELTRLRGHADYIHALAFSPDGTRLVSGSGDATVRVWDTRPVRERWAALTAARSP